MKPKINQKGIFITFMVFLLVASVLALHDVTKKTDSMQERKNIQEIVFNSVNNAFNNLYEEVISLNKEGYARAVQQRPMPFEYDFNGNAIILRQRIPLREYRLKSYVDALNIYRIFANDSNATDLNIVTETIQNSQWGGLMDYPDLNYVILPQCLLYDVNNCCYDQNLMTLRELQGGEYGCMRDFNYTDLNMVDVNILINSRGCTTGSIGGNLAGKAEPTHQEFDPTETKPYLRIMINERNINCPGAAEDCPVTQTASGRKVIRTHFDPEDLPPPDTVIDSVTVSCDGDWLRVKIGKESATDRFPVVIHSWQSSKPVYVDLNITFDQKVELFYFTGFSISVNKKNFSIKRST